MLLQLRLQVITRLYYHETVESCARVWQTYSLVVSNLGIPHLCLGNLTTASNHLFEGLESNYKQQQFFEEHFPHVKPIAAKLRLKDIMCKKK